MATVDVVIPCYKYAHYLEGCVRSVLDQPGVDVRVLIIDDCSPDNTAEVGAALAASDPRVEFRRHEVNKGHIATYNEGLLEWSTSDYVSLLSADDLLAPGCLSRAVDIMENDRRIGMVYGHAPYFERNDEVAKRGGRYKGFTRWSGAEWIEGRCRSGYNVISSPEVVVRGSVQRQVGGYRPELPHAGDLEMWLRIAAVSDIAYVRGAPQAFYRVHRSSMQRTSYSSFVADSLQRRLAFLSALEFMRGRVPNVDELEFFVRRRLASTALDRVCRSYERDRADSEENRKNVEFALETFADVTSLTEWKKVEHWRKVGRRSRWFPTSLASAAFRRSRELIVTQRWMRSGI